MLVCNKEQAVLSLKKSKLIELLYQLMVHYLARVSKKKKEDAVIFKSICRILAALIHLEDARSQVLSGRGSKNNSYELLQTFVTLAAKVEWTLLERMERSEMVVNSLKTLRLLTDDQESL